MQITVKIKDIEIIYSEPQSVTGYPRIVTTDPYKDDKTKSDRILEVIHSIVDEAIRAYNETNKQQS